MHNDRYGKHNIMTMLLLVAITVSILALEQEKC